MKSNLKVTALIVSNYKRLKAISIDINEKGVTLISGDNNAGKTTVLDCFKAFTGKKFHGTEPIRKGQTEASIEIHVEDEVERLKLKLRWWFTKSKKLTYEMVIENEDGSKIGSPTEMMKLLMSEVSLDPEELIRMTGTERVKRLKEIVPLSIDLDKLQAERKQIFKERAVVNLEVDGIKKLLRGMDIPDDDTPEKEISISDLLAKQSKQEKQLKDNEVEREKLKLLKQQKTEAQTTITIINDEIAELLATVESKKQLISQHEETIATIDTKGERQFALVESLQDPDIEATRTEMKELETKNISIRKAAEYRSKQAEFDSKKTISADKTADIKVIDDTITEALTNAKFPLPDLIFGDDDIEYKGFPFEQCAESDKLTITSAIIMKTKPKVQLLMIEDWSRLGKKKQEAYEKLADDNNYQILTTIVDTSGKLGIMIVDGEVSNTENADDMW